MAAAPARSAPANAREARDAASADRLSTEQRAATAAIREETQREAAPLAAALAATVEESFDEMLSQGPDPSGQERYAGARPTPSPG